MDTILDTQHFISYILEILKSNHNNYMVDLENLYASWKMPYQIFQPDKMCINLPLLRMYYSLDHSKFTQSNHNVVKYLRSFHPFELPEDYHNIELYLNDIEHDCHRSHLIDDNHVSNILLVTKRPSNPLDPNDKTIGLVNSFKHSNFGKHNIVTVFITNGMYLEELPNEGDKKNYCHPQIESDDFIMLTIILLWKLQNNTMNARFPIFSSDRFTYNFIVHFLLKILPINKNNLPELAITVNQTKFMVNLPILHDILMSMIHENRQKFINDILIERHFYKPINLVALLLYQNKKQIKMYRDGTLRLFGYQKSSMVPFTIINRSFYANVSSEKQVIDNSCYKCMNYSLETYEFIIHPFLTAKLPYYYTVYNIPSYINPLSIFEQVSDIYQTYIEKNQFIFTIASVTIKKVYTKSHLARSGSWNVSSLREDYVPPPPSSVSEESTDTLITKNYTYSSNRKYFMIFEVNRMLQAVFDNFTKILRYMFNKDPSIIYRKYFGNYFEYQVIPMIESDFHQFKNLFDYSKLYDLDRVHGKITGFINDILQHILHIHPIHANDDTLNDYNLMCQVIDKNRNDIIDRCISLDHNRQLKSIIA